VIAAAVLLAALVLAGGCSASTTPAEPSVSTSPADAAGSDWRVLADSEDAPAGLDAATTWYEIAAPDADHAWMVGMGGGVRATSDGGLTWRAQDVRLGSSATDTAHLCAVDASHVWGVDVEGRIVSTADGGATWATQDLSPASFSDVSFGDTHNGWAVGGDDILHTTDGGATWQPQAAPLGKLEDHDGLASVFALDPQRAWVVRVHLVVADDAIQRAIVTVYATSDGGEHWNRLWSGEDTGWQVQFVDESHGWLSGAGLWATRDGGETWRQQRSLGSWVTDASFVDRLHGWAARNGLPRRKGILETEDGGATWSFRSLKSLGMSHGQLSEVWDIAFSDAEHGWAVGDDGRGQLVARHAPR
jgi:photosystem II stability/assembly factor-like uncharacterized protein